MFYTAIYLPMVRPFIVRFKVRHEDFRVFYGVLYQGVNPNLGRVQFPREKGAGRARTSMTSRTSNTFELRFRPIAARPWEADRRWISLRRASGFDSR